MESSVKDLDQWIEQLYSGNMLDENQVKNLCEKLVTYNVHTLI